MHRSSVSALSVLSLVLAACGADPGPAPAPAAAVCPEPATGGEVAAPLPAAPAPATSPPAETRTVVLDGCPEVSPALRERINQFINTRSASVADLSADGTSLAVITRFGNTAQLHEVRRPLGARRQLTFNEEPVRRAEVLPGDPNRVLYLSDVGGAENFQIFALDRRTGRSTRLTDGRSRHEAWLTSRDGSLLAFNSNARNGRDIDVYLARGTDLAGARRLTELSGSYAPVDFSPDGTKLLVAHFVSIADTRLYVVELATGALRRITPEAPTAAYREALFAPDGQHLYVTTDRDGEFVELYEAPLEGDAPWRPLTRSIPWNVEHIALAHDGRTLALATNEDGWSVLRLLDTRTRRLSLVPGVPRAIIDHLDFAREAPVLALTLLGPTQTGDAYTYDLRARRLERWTESEMGGLDPSTLIEPSLVRFESFDRRSIPAFYYRPRGQGPFPVVINIHGGPEAQSRPWFSPLMQYLASELGVAVLVPNVRGSDGYGKTYLSLDNGRLREDSVRDIGALLDWVATRPELDRARVAVHGGSYGGYMVLASLVHFGDRIRAGVDVVGVSSFVTFLENTSEYRRDLRRVEYGDERDAEMRAFLETISPLSRASSIRSALFVAHGANDPRVPASEAEQVVGAVRGSGQDVWYMLARNEGHGFVRKENSDLFAQLAASFLERHLLATPPSSPAPPTPAPPTPASPTPGPSGPPPSPSAAP
jgi:dipeptidyl aminopeptidase/acylaminoacyl peptidase